MTQKSYFSTISNSSTNIHCTLVACNQCKNLQLHWHQHLMLLYSFTGRLQYNPLVSVYVKLKYHPQAKKTFACVEYHFVLRYKYHIWPAVHAIFTGWHRKPRDIPTVTLRYWIQESSLMKYPTHPSGRGRKRPYPALGMCWIFHSGWFLHPISQNITLGCGLV